MRLHHFVHLRKNQALIAVIVLFMLFTNTIIANVGQVRATGSTGKSQHLVANNTAVTTYHNDNMRTGQTTNEQLLNRSNVNADNFGLRVSYPVDGQVYAQPLFVPNVLINNKFYNVVYVATENDSVYAFDADQTNTTGPLWQTSFVNASAGITPVPALDVYAPGDALISPVVGITGTPVIDQVNGILYVVAFTKENGQYIQRLHALDIVTGGDRAGSPLQIQASVPGQGDGSVNGIVSFDPHQQVQRTALLLLNGKVYISWGSFSDADPYHGWMIGYTYTGSGFQQSGADVYNDTPNGQRGGIWMSQGGPASDANGNIYISTGNGTFNLNTGGQDAGDSYVKFNARNGLQVTDYFTPFNQSCLASNDLDIGSSETLLLPDQPGLHPHLLVGMGKENRLYVVNRDNMGQFTNDPHLQCGQPEEQSTNIDHIVQEIPPGTGNGLFGSTSYWGGEAGTGRFIYIGASADNLRAYRLQDGLVSTQSVSNSPESFSYPGATPSISSNGGLPGTGIVWVNSAAPCNNVNECQPLGSGELRAYDATNLNHELYNSEQNAARDRVDSYVKFSLPTIANGEVFVGTQTSLDIYGLLKSQTRTTTIDDSVRGRGLNQFTYVNQWKHCTSCRNASIPLYDGTESSSLQANSYVTLAFIGTRISFYGVKRSRYGVGIISVDNRSTTLINFFAPVDAGNQLLWTSPNLGPGVHLLKLRATATKDRRSSGYSVSVDRVDIAN